jgi:hypothetical protein
MALQFLLNIENVKFFDKINKNKLDNIISN